MENNNFKEIWNKIKKSEKILIPLHPSPDGDSLGACTGFKYLLKNYFDKNSEVISYDDLSENIKEFDFSKEVEFGRELTCQEIDNFDLILFLDHGTIGQYPKKVQEKIQNSRKKIVNIDHHKTNSFYGGLNYVNPNSPSCCSILVDFFKEILKEKETEKADFDRELSRRLFLGICTDTDFFIYNDSLDSIKKAGFLIEKGNIDYFNEFFQPIKSDSWNLKKIYGILLNNMKRTKIHEKTVAYSFVKKEDLEKEGINSSEMRLGILCMQNIKNMDIIFVLYELDKGIKCSFRSSNVDTSVFSKKLGGGGHKGASSVIINKKDYSLNEAINLILKTIGDTGIKK